MTEHFDASDPIPASYQSQVHHEQHRAFACASGIIETLGTSPETRNLDALNCPDFPLGIGGNTRFKERSDFSCHIPPRIELLSRNLRKNAILFGGFYNHSHLDTDAIAIHKPPNNWSEMTEILTVS